MSVVVVIFFVKRGGEEECGGEDDGGGETVERRFHFGCWHHTSNLMPTISPHSHHTHSLAVLDAVGLLGAASTASLALLAHHAPSSNPRQRYWALPPDRCTSSSQQLCLCLSLM